MSAQTLNTPNKLGDRTISKFFDTYLAAEIAKFDEEIPLDEMASRSGRSVAAVKKQLWKIRRTLQECIENRMAIEGESS